MMTAVSLAILDSLIKNNSEEAEQNPFVSVLVKYAGGMLSPSRHEPLNFFYRLSLQTKQSEEN